MTPTSEVEQQQIADAIRAATLEVFSMMMGLDIVPGETLIRKTAQDSHSGVTAMLGLTGEWVGSGQFSCEPAFACRIASQLLMSNYEAVDDEVLDAIAEVANMIVGSVKTTLEDRFGRMGLSTPTVLFGGVFETRIAGNPDWVVVPFECAGDSMIVQVVLARASRYRSCPKPAAAVAV